MGMGQEVQEMRGGGHKNAEATKAQNFLDPRSYVRLDGAQFIFGRDMTNRRREVWERDGRKCVYCETPVVFEWDWTVRPDAMELNHRRSRGLGGDDRIENLETICHGCHVIRHVMRTDPSRKT